MTTTLARALCIALLLVPFAVPTLAQDTSEAARVVGDLRIQNAWTRQTPPGARAGGGYATITNMGSEADRLIGGTASFAERFEVHEMSVTEGVMRMSPLKDGLVIGPNETVALEPGGFHLMFIGITEPLVEGTTVSITLTFERAGKIALELPVAGIGATTPGKAAMRHDMSMSEGMGEQQ